MMCLDGPVAGLRRGSPVAHTPYRSNVMDARVMHAKLVEPGHGA